MPAVLGRHDVVTSKGPDCPSMLQPGERKQSELEKGCEAPFSASLCPSPGQGGSSNMLSGSSFPTSFMLCLVSA